jgi:hypothetical protein
MTGLFVSINGRIGRGRNWSELHEYINHMGPAHHGGSDMNKKWPDSDVEKLRKTYPYGIVVACEALPNYSNQAIRTKAQRLCIPMLKTSKRTNNAPPVPDEKILAVLRQSGGMSKVRVADAVGLTVHAMQYRLNQLRDRELADTRGEGIKTIWIALTSETKTGVIPDEYIKVASIWSVGRRVEKLMEAAHD